MGFTKNIKLLFEGNIKNGKTFSVFLFIFLN